MLHLHNIFRQSTAEELDVCMDSFLSSKTLTSHHGGLAVYVSIPTPMQAPLSKHCVLTLDKATLKILNQIMRTVKVSFFLLCSM